MFWLLHIIFVFQFQFFDQSICCCFIFKHPVLFHFSIAFITVFHFFNHLCNFFHFFNCLHYCLIFFECLIFVSFSSIFPFEFHFLQSSHLNFIFFNRLLKLANVTHGQLNLCLKDNFNFISKL